MTATILVIDDMADVRMSAHFLLSNHGYEVIEAKSPDDGIKILEEHNIELIILDMNYSADTTSGSEGLAFIKLLGEESITTPVIAMTGWSSVELAVKAMQLGAGDFIEKPWENRRLIQVVEQQLKLAGLKQQNQRLRQQNTTLLDEQLLWKSSSMLKLKAEIERLAPTDATILLTGENGTGKSSIAKAIHRLSSRHEQGLVTVNMGAIPESLFESEMFGHKKGAFTDAKEARVGRFEMAQGGTLFFDEIATIPQPQQAKLLRVLESGEYEPVGSNITQQADVRLISASNADFPQLIADGHFRADLFYRLNTIEIRIPPLRERLDDICPLAEFFVDEHCIKYGRAKVNLAEDAKTKLLDYQWPGNVRELSHVMERAVLLLAGNTITASDMQLGSSKVVTDQHSNTNQDELTPDDSHLPLMTLEAAELQLLKLALEKTQGSTSEAAELLGISKSAIYRRMDKYDLKA